VNLRRASVLTTTVLSALAIIEAYTGCSSSSDGEPGPKDSGSDRGTVCVGCPDDSGSSNRACDPSKPFGTPVLLPNVNSAAEDTAVLSPDELTIYVGNRMGGDLHLSRATRAKIFDAATELIAQQGYHATSVDRIAARAGVAKATFFVHFASKAEVIATLVRRQIAKAREARQKALPHGPIATLRTMVEALGRLAARSRTLSRGVLAATLESEELGGAATALFDEVLAEMTADARAAREAGLLAPGVEPETLASSLLAAYFGALLTASHKPTSNMRVVLASLIESILRGACHPAAPRQP